MQKLKLGAVTLSLNYANFRFKASDKMFNIVYIIRYLLISNAENSNWLEPASVFRLVLTINNVIHIND
jgi:hypothetical protein